MSPHKAQGRSIIALSMFSALMLDIMPWPQMLMLVRPMWLEMVLIYWVLALPHRVNIGTAFVLGCILDLILGSPLGVHALALSAMTYFASFRFQMVRNMNLWQQGVVVCLLTLFSNLLVFWIEALVSDSKFHVVLLFSTLINLVLWPWVFLFLRQIRRAFSVK